MTGLCLADSYKCAFCQIRDGLLYEASREGHAGDFDEDLEGEEIHCWIGTFLEEEVVLARSGLDRSVGDGVLEDAHMTCFGVADLLNAVVCRIREAEIGE